MNTATCTVRLSGLRKSYRVGESSVEALKGVSLEVCSGEMVALTGPSGSGKSTLLNLCGLIDTQDAGSRELGGIAIDGLDEIGMTRLRREKVGFIFQGFNLVPVMTVFDNVEYPSFFMKPPTSMTGHESEINLEGLLTNGVHEPERAAEFYSNAEEYLRRTIFALKELGSKHTIDGTKEIEFCEKLQRETHSKQGIAKRESKYPWNFLYEIPGWQSLNLTE